MDKEYVRIIGASQNSQHSDAIDQAINHMVGESTKYINLESNTVFEIEAISVVFVNNNFSAVIVGKYPKRCRDGLI
jgi:hypothetical protein